MLISAWPARSHQARHAGAERRQVDLPRAMPARRAEAPGDMAAGSAVAVAGKAIVISCVAGRTSVLTPLQAAIA